MNAALAASMAHLLQQLRQTLTWLRGKELSGHAQFTLETRTKVFFADPRSPWQRPANENTNGLLRRYFPKGTDLPAGLQRISKQSPSRSTIDRKALGWKTPADVFAEQLRSLQEPDVATAD